MMGVSLDISGFPAGVRIRKVQMEESLKRSHIFAFLVATAAA